MKYLNYQGRINRAPYIWAAIGFSIILEFMDTWKNYDSHANLFLIFIVQIFLAFLFSFITVKRLHDLGRRSWHFWLLLVPLYGLYLGILLLAQKGVNGTNEYGPNPLVAANSESAADNSPHHKLWGD